MMVWNCNGSLRTDIRYFEDTLKHTNIAVYTETCQCIDSKFPYVHGYRWLSRSGRVLYKDELRDRVGVVHKDVSARYLWIQIQRGNCKEL
jgi:hypothetical protein